MFRVIYRKIRSAVRVSNNLMRNLNSPPIIVLLYHRVANLTSDPQLLAVSQTNFEAQMQYIKNHYHIVRFDEPWVDIKSPAVAVTFDDGYADNYYNAMPILEKYDIPATIFVSSGNIDKNREFWWDNLERLILLNDHLPKELSIHVMGNDYTFNLSNRELVENCYQDLHPILKKIDAEERENILDQLDEQLQPNIAFRDAYRTMTAKELKNIAQSPVINLGGHTVTHTQLSTQNEAEQVHEIETSRNAIESIIDKKLTTFSYPFGGRTDYNPVTVKILKQCGYEKIASNFPGQFHSGDSLMEIPRHLVRNWDITEFERRLKRFWYV